jgi:hypothetical protein
MSTTPESGSREFELDLDLHFLPAWAQKPPTENKYAKYEGGEEGRGRRGYSDRRDVRDRPPRRDSGGDRPRGDRSAGPRGGRPGGDRGRPQPRPEPVAPPIDLNLSIVPEDKGVESLARQIRLTGRAYPLFDIAFLILKKPDRYTVRFNVIKKPDGQPAQPLFLCDLDETLWLSEQEAVDHVLNKHFSTFYQSEKIPTDPPKGTYTFVAQCGMSGTILGPPNYHDYQNKIRKLHAERFSRIPFEMYKARIKIVRDEPIVKKWLEDQSWRTEYICINVPESLKLGNREDVEKHFRETHLANVIKPIESHTLGGTAAQSLPSRPLQNLVRRNWEEQMRFPLKVVNVLSQQFASHGLQFFKVNKTVTHVAVARPRYIDLEQTPVSEGIKRIVDFINHTRNCSRRKILEALAPGVPLQAPQPGEASPAAESTPPTPEAAAVVSDLHWLIHEGHVIEFANGLIELAKKPVIRPPKPSRPAQSTAPGANAAATTPESPADTSGSEPLGEVTGEQTEESQSSASDSINSGPDEQTATDSQPDSTATEESTEPVANSNSETSEPAPQPSESK